MSLQMVAELRAVLAAVRDDRQVRALVIGGAGGHFCAGADIKDMANARAQGQTAYRELNRAFGALLEETQHAPQVVITVLQGAVLGGGFGLACVSDIAMADHQAQFGLPETSLGLLPAQIAPFVVQRIGLTQARRLALTAARFDGNQARRMGLVHFVEHDPQALAERLDEVLAHVLCCAPGANAATKKLLLASAAQLSDGLLDQAAEWFSEAVTGDEGVEGTMAFVQKRKPGWAI
jgi:isohexenylglutaconyl-CoA hydratase